MVEIGLVMDTPPGELNEITETGQHFGFPLPTRFFSLGFLKFADAGKKEKLVFRKPMQELGHMSHL